jgi:hypothetical protein
MLPKLVLLEETKGEEKKTEKKKSRKEWYRVNNNEIHHIYVGTGHTK